MRSLSLPAPLRPLLRLLYLPFHLFLSLHKAAFLFLPLFAAIGKVFFGVTLGLPYPLEHPAIWWVVLSLCVVILWRSARFWISLGPAYAALGGTAFLVVLLFDRNTEGISVGELSRQLVIFAIAAWQLLRLRRLPDSPRLRAAFVVCVLCALIGLWLGPESGVVGSSELASALWQLGGLAILAVAVGLEPQSEQPMSLRRAPR